MPTSSGAYVSSSSYSSASGVGSMYDRSSGRSGRLLPKRHTPPAATTRANTHQYGSYTSSPKVSSVREKTSQLLSSNYSRDHEFKDFKTKIDINNNPSPSSRSSANNGYTITTSPSSLTTTSSVYGAHQYQKSHTTAVSSGLSNSSSRSNSVDSYYPTSVTRSHRNSIGAQNRNDSCSSYDTDTVTSGSSQAERGNVGLTNLGNTCFMNSVLQCLINTKKLIDYVSNRQMKADINRSTSSMKGGLMEEYSKLVRRIWEEANSATSVAPRELRSKVTTFAPKFGGYNQQDSQEFLRYFLQGLHEDVNRVKSKPKYIGHDEAAEERMSDDEKAREYWNRYINFDNSAIVDLFVGQLKSELICQSCGYKSVTFDPFWDLSLPIPKRGYGVDIKDCMESFMKEEILDGDERPTCSKCKLHRKCTKTFKIQRFPKILVLHLKRFSGERFRQKLQTKVDFELRSLSLSQFSVDTGKSVKYNLYGISNHVGTVYSGHYTAYCKHPYSQCWYSFNDSRVSSMSERHLVSEEAYLLFYELEE